MLRYHSYDIVFQEVPDEVTLAINVTNCPNGCKGCHSIHLQQNIGKFLDISELKALMEKYGSTITCVCFMGGDSSVKEVEKLAVFIREITGNRIKSAWYSGKKNFPDECSVRNFDYIKLGPYVERLGGLDSLTTNQRFYRIENGQMVDITSCFHKKIAAS